MRRIGLFLMALCCVFTLIGCGAEPTEPSLPLVEYIDPASAYIWQIPDGWNTSVSGSVLTITNPDQSSPEGLQIRVFLESVNETSTEAEAQAIRNKLGLFLGQTLDEEYQVYNEGETKVNRLPSMILDFAKPHGDTYLVGREVVVMAPSAALAFIGTGERETWENFLPTFRKMLGTFELVGFVAPEYLP